jgi:ribonuclease Z
MKLTILGTGNAAVSECYNTCCVLSDKEEYFLVDAGGGNRILKLLKDAGIELEDIHNIFVTHEHIDHVLGVIWLIRMIGQRMNQGKYEGDLRIYCHQELAEKIQTIASLTIQKKVCRHMGERIQFVKVESGEQREIMGCTVTFFDIASTKAKQFGFTMKLKNGGKFTCVGDEPYNEANYEYVKGSSWLLHEAFCLYAEADKFKPYEKHHSTVKEACQLAEELGVPNLLLYHTEETHLKERKELYTAEGQEYYHGNLYVPDDMEEFIICT